MAHEQDPVDWDKIMSKDNHSVEELSPEEIKMLEEYERQQTEIRMSGVPAFVAEKYIGGIDPHAMDALPTCHKCGREYLPDEKNDDGYCSLECYQHDQI